MAETPHPLGYAQHDPTGPDLAPVPPRPWPVELLDALWSIPAWALFALIVIGLPVGVCVSISGPILGYPVLVLLIVLIPSIAIAVRNVRRRRAAAVLGYLQQAFELNMPLDRFLDAAGRSEPYPLNRRLYDVREVLLAGGSLTSALQRRVPELSERAIGIIEHAERMGKLPETLSRLLGEQVDASRRRRPDRALEVWYPPILLLIAGGVVYLLSVFIAPRYRDMFHDFGVKMPALSQAIFDSADWLVWALVAVAAIYVGASGLRLRESITSRPPNRLGQSLKCRFLWLMPVIHAVLYDRALADLCTALADSVEGGRPFDQALQQARQLDLPVAVHHRLERWEAAVASGTSIDRAAAAAGFPALLSGMVNPAAGDAGLLSGLHFVARYYADRSTVRREVIRNLYLPVVTIIMGIIVALVAIGMFLPLQRLILHFGGGMQ